MSPRLWLAAASVSIALALPAAAQAQNNFDFRYGITVAGISIGKATWTGAIGADQYSTAASGQASGLIKVLLSGTGEVKVDGAMKEGRPVPALFVSTVKSDDETSQFSMKLDNGNVKELTATEPPPSADRISITDAHKQGISDPLSAMIIPMSGDLNADLCNRQLQVFDGRRRFDLKLAYKRVDKVKADRGYAGPVVVCALTFQPIAGHRPSSTIMKFLSEGRDIELWLAPIPGAKLTAPFRLTVANMLGNLTVQASTFEGATQSAAAPK